MISGRTVILGVIGDPITHSFSPYLHNGVAATLGLDLCYVPYHVNSDSLQDAVAGLKALGVRGFNVTVPHKEAIMSYLDHCDEVALAMGAVNTVVNRDGQLYGYNTDGKGFLYALSDHHNETIQGKHIVFLGAGGTAKALSYVCLKNQVASLSIINRSLDKASLLQKELLTLNGDVPIHVFSRDDDASLAVLKQADLIINVTSLGLSSDDDLPVVSTDWFRTEQCLVDVIYNPKETQFLLLGREHGLKTINGLAMLAAQAAYAFELFVDRDAPFDEFFSMLADL
ncbi:MAG: shikimate dehydrogenase [Actinobacteria bacterium]|nr:shikimate dehydrogenase [Actinomycetota bacterium]|tara:strand:+ start:16468 stop:17319 length:852 start_codon:yes stop_codon:yes gene_type:complete